MNGSVSDSLTAFVIPTRARGELLHRALASYAENARRHGHGFDPTVVDDGPPTDDGRLGRYPTYYRAITRPARVRAARAAAHALTLDERLVKFCLLGEDACVPTTGAARNTALLATAGRVVVSVDDDTVAAFSRPAGDDSDAPESRSPESIWLNTAATSVDVDFISEMTDPLGSTARALGMSDSAIEARRALMDRPIVASMAGSSGDPGMEKAPHLLLDAVGFARIASDDVVYAQATRSRRLLRVASQRRVSASAGFMTLACGLDNRVLLPPFCPVHRNQDGIYGVLLQCIFGPAPIAHIPIAVEHGGARPERPWGDEIWTSIVPTRFSDVLIRLLTFLVTPPLGGTLADRTRHIGYRLSSVGGMADDSFRRLALEAIRVGSQERRDALYRKLGERPLPRVVEADLVRAIRRVSQACNEPSQELPDGGTVRQWRRFVAAYGGSLIVWPSLRGWMQERPQVWDGQASAHGAADTTRVMHRSRQLPAFACPLCGGRFEKMEPFGHAYGVLAASDVIGGGVRQSARCPCCRSLDRERLVFLYLYRKTHIFNEGGRILHIAPEPCLARCLQSFPLIKCVTADIARRPVTLQTDVMRIAVRPHLFDVIICNHVLEHVEDDLLAMAELRRVLKPSGFAILQVPIASALERTREDSAATTAAERETLFGQHNHRRLYGRDYPARLLAAGFQCRLYDPQTDIGAANVRRYGLIDREKLHIAFPVHRPAVSTAPHSPYSESW